MQETLKNIFFVHSAPLNSYKANTIQTLHTVAALSRQNRGKIFFWGRAGREKNWLELVADHHPYFENIVLEGQIVKIPEMTRADRSKFAAFAQRLRLSFLLETIYFLTQIYMDIFSKLFELRREVNWIYTRSHYIILALLPLKIFFKKLSYAIELHDVPSSRFSKITWDFTLQHCDHIFAVTSFFKDYIPEGLSHAYTVLPDGVDECYFSEAFNLVGDNKSTVRQFGYFGRLTTYGKDKGIFDLINAFSLLDPNDEFSVLLIGANTDELREYGAFVEAKGLHDKIEIIPFMAANEARMIAHRCDVLLMPHPRNRFFEHFVSPLKLFEYMALGKVIVNARLPAIEEILPRDKFSISYEPGNIGQLADVLSKCINNYSELTHLGVCVMREARKYTWDQRAVKILNGMI
ncbi:glycosyltransferase family 4 protein [Roseobacter sp. HKCCA0882]|uniref:glycosyltransferase family 4 protein n=1 Tax=Roseobacter sp. HKCCA0882 TaxID=3120337 RepID=UPI0030ECD98A